ncbi:cupin domain-containing protein [Paenibacillus oralis]|uniref:Cupin domain-containing protein n=2 Tax=Paenibacillus oralis TaxID=2490856 RepID=A0A3P3U5Y9_9BACL|nr:cupin domain-containing protein [Paenibacillus oralis]
MNMNINKLPQSKVLKLADEITVEQHQSSSKTLVQRPDLGMTLFALDQGEEIKKHSSSGDAMVNVIEGIAEITIGDEVHTVKAGETIIMPANIPHGLKAVEAAFKMLLIVVK